jgi:hypothetical protein
VSICRCSSVRDTGIPGDSELRLAVRASVLLDAVEGVFGNGLSVTILKVFADKPILDNHVHWAEPKLRRFLS